MNSYIFPIIYGSLTTSLCSEGLQWVILKTPVKISKVQVTNIGPSARPIQPLGERTIQENSKMAFFRAEDSLRLYLFSRFLL